MKKIHYYSELFTSLLTRKDAAAARRPDETAVLEEFSRPPALCATVPSCGCCAPMIGARLLTNSAVRGARWNVPEADDDPQEPLPEFEVAARKAQRRTPGPRAPVILSEDGRSQSLYARKIDVHQHCVSEEDEGLAALLKVNAEYGIVKSVLLSLRMPNSTRRDVRRRNDWVLAMGEKYKGEVVPFVTVIEDDPRAPQMFASALNRGAKGLKLIGWHSEQA